MRAQEHPLHKMNESAESQPETESNTDLHLIQPLMSVYSHLCPQGFGQNQDVTWYGPIRPENNTKYDDRDHVSMFY